MRLVAVAKTLTEKSAALSFFRFALFGMFDHCVH